ncbi:MAG: SRPBCC family protein [Chloroflexi bacterium]|nr:SRPBCC family protein [Chloroflexota bacterium]
MTIDVTAEATIARPRCEVIAFACDPANDAQWIAGIKEAHAVTPGPIGVGSQVARVASFLGRKIEYINEIDRLDQSVLEMHSVKGPFPMHITYTFDQDGAGTLARIRIQGDATGFFRLAAPLLAAQVRRSITRDVNNLKRVLEAPG